MPVERLFHHIHLLWGWTLDSIGAGVTVFPLLPTCPPLFSPLAPPLTPPGGSKNVESLQEASQEGITGFVSLKECHHGSPRSMCVYGLVLILHGYGSERIVPAYETATVSFSIFHNKLRTVCACVCVCVCVLAGIRI